MDNKKIFMKFVIPCWGIEKTIGRMLNSILSQSFTDYHIVCVEDCSPDKTWAVLQDYKKRYPNKITLIKNPKNLGAGESRNIGVQQTMDSLPCEYLWVVDGDDWIADKSVLQKIYDFAKKNPQFVIINLGWTFMGKYEVARCGWPVGLPGRVIRPSVYIPAPKKNITQGNDVYPHFVMFDQVDDSKIGALNYKCYVCPKPGMHRNNTVNGMNSAKEVGMALMQHKFKKQNVVDTMKNKNIGTWDWIKGAYPEFNPIVEKPESPAKSRKVSILMASFPYRKKWMLQCIERLIPQCDNFYLWLNEYKEIPEELKTFDQNKLHITLGEKNLKENGRYTFLQKPELQNDYCFICDDDINWPKDYVKNTLECFKRHSDAIVIAYYVHGTMDFVQQHFNDEIRSPITAIQGCRHCRFGLGTSAFVPGLTKFMFTNDELVAHLDIEIFFGQQCLDRKLPIYAPKRPRNWINFIRSTQVNCGIDKYALHMSNVAQRTRKTLEYMTSKKKTTTNSTLKKYPKPISGGTSLKKFIRYQYG